MSRSNRVSLTIFAVLFVSNAFAQVNIHKPVTYDVPGATDTELYAINDLNHVAGQYIAKNGSKHGFLAAYGRVVTIAYPGAMQTVPLGINNLDVVVGYYTRKDQSKHGFIRLPWGHYTTIDFPNSTMTELDDINNWGQIAGTYASATGYQSFRMNLRGTMTDTSLPDMQYTWPASMTDSGVVVGSVQAFAALYSRAFAGANLIFDLPGWGTRATGITRSGYVVGYYYSVNSSTCMGRMAYVRSPSGDYTYLKLPASAAPLQCDTAIEDMNGRNVMVGSYYDANHRHGFIAQLSVR